MLRISLALRLTKSLMSARTTQIRWFRKDDDDGGGGGYDGGSWAERERALEGAYIRKLDYENMERLRKRLARKRACERKQREEEKKGEKDRKETDEAEDED